MNYSNNSSEMGYFCEYSSVTENGLNPVDTVSTGYNKITSLSGALTLTPADLVSGLIVHDPAGGAINSTLPTAADLIKAMRSSSGTGFYVSYKNNADANEVITIVTNTGMTLHGTFTVAQNTTRNLLIIQRNDTEVDVYSLGEIAH